VAGAPTGGAHFAFTFDCCNETDPMTITTRFGKKNKVPSTFQIRHQILLFWLKNQVAEVAAEDRTSGRQGRQGASKGLQKVPSARECEHFCSDFVADEGTHQQRSKRRPV
jgi:hypothetical protein